jgi:type III secretory pathway component EscS
MTPDTIGQLARDAILLSVLMTAPLAVAAAVVGLLFGLVQALTQLQDQTMTFVVKLFVVFGLILVLLPWLGSLVTSFGDRAFTAILQPR